MAINLEVNVNPIPLGVEPGNVDLGVGGSYIQSPIIPDNSITDAKLVQEGGVLSAVADLEDRVEAIEADYATASDLDALSDEVRNSLAITDTASGAVASFPDGADGQKVRSLVAKIEPKQAGSGDPSPSNIRPITGSDGVTVRRTGKNLFDISKMESRTGVTVSGSTFTGTPRNFTANGLVEPISFPVGTTLTVQCKAKSDGVGTDGAGFALVFVCEDNSTLRPWYTNNNETTETFHSGSVTATSAIIGYRFWDYNHGTDNTWTVKDFQIELGSSATAYEPYSGTTLPVTFPSTVYGGEVDVVSGVLRVTHGFKTLNGSESWSAHGSIASWFYLDSVFDDSYVNTTVKDFAISNKYVQNAYNLAAVYENGEFGIGLPTGGSHNRIIIKDTAYSTVAQFKTALGSTPVQIAYRLASPTIVQLSTNDLETLKGVNNIWADAGDTSVVYLADTKLYIDKKLTELVAQIVNS